ncbi:MAG: glycosyltransferase family 4 protein [Planctomycetes bacterium]|nr:glycosyltransferase family 4 protein [Planctomycetota bacterium]
MVEDAVRVLVVAENASARQGGEAFLPLHHFRLLRERGVEAWLLVHARNQGELEALLPQELDRMRFVPDTLAHRALWAVGRFLPQRLEAVSTGAVSHAITQVIQRRMARRMVAEARVDVVHAPNPVSPRQPSALHDVGAPVVVGPMNGGMDLPRAFRRRAGWLERLGVTLGRLVAEPLNLALPGKRRAALLLVANARTREALPRVVRHVRVAELPENGVDNRVFHPRARPSGGPVRFVYIGRLVGWKGVDLLLEAFARVARAWDVRLDVCGDGPERAALQRQARRLELGGQVTFRGFLPHGACADRLRASDVLVLPSLYECGGAVVLEGMASGLPIIASRWGGPTDYVDERCGVLVEPSSRDAFVEGLADAMLRLARDPGLRRSMGQAGRRQAVARFDWLTKVERMLELYGEVAGVARGPRRPATAWTAPPVLSPEVEAGRPCPDPAPA